MQNRKVCPARLSTLPTRITLIRRKYLYILEIWASFMEQVIGKGGRNVGCATEYLLHQTPNSITCNITTTKHIHKQGAPWL